MAVSLNILDQMHRELANVRYNDRKKVREEYFGKVRQTSTSHAIF